MESRRRRQRLDPLPSNVPTQGASTNAYRNDFMNNFDGAGISNAGGNFHVAGDINIHSSASPQPNDEESEDEERREAEEERKAEEERWIEKRNELTQSLQFEQIDARHESIKKAHVKTCHWFLDTDAYKKWTETNSLTPNNFLWIKSKPGAGKSTLMKFLYDQIRARIRRANSDEILISFFFNARGHELEKSTIGLYRSLVWQLLDKNPGIQKILDDLQLGYEWTVEPLKSLLEEAIQGLGEIPIICLIDALDECDQDQIRDTVLFLEELVAVQKSLHVCVASRHYPHITVDSDHEIILDQREGHEQDISIYLSSALRIKPNELAEQIRSEIQGKANGVFIWVVLVVKILNKEYDSGYKYRLRERLKQIPGDLDLLFRNILTRDTNNSAGFLLCIQWLLFAKEPLTPRQLYLAIISGTEPEFLPTCHSEPDLEEDVQKYILNTSKGLAESTRSEIPTVQFIHESIKDFLLKGDSLGDLFNDIESNIRGESHEALKQCCLNYVTMKSFMELKTSTSDQTIEAFPFLRYANSEILYHGNQAGLHGISQDSFLARFPWNQWVTYHNLFEESRTRRYKPTVSLLYVLAEADFSALIRDHSGCESCFETEDETYVVPILVALALKHDLAVQAMITRQARQTPGFNFSDFYKRFQAVETKSRLSGRPFKLRRNRRPVEELIRYWDERLLLLCLETTEYSSWSRNVDLSALFSLACQNGRFETARFLAKVCTFSSTTQGRDTPLHCASMWGVVEAAKHLVNRGADLNAKTISGWTPLHYAAQSGRHDVAHLLIDCGAYVSAVDNDGKTPLHLASIYHRQIVRLLLDHGANTRAVDKSGRTPLHEACRCGEFEIARLLIDHDADISARTMDGDTPLHQAAWAHPGDEKIVGLLIERGADISAMGSNKETPLHLACINSNRVTVQQLLDSHANVSATNKKGKTPLHKACQGIMSDDKVGIVKLLIEFEADPSAVTRKAETPLHLLLLDADYGIRTDLRLEVAKILINSGADVSVSDKKGRTPLQLALSKDYWRDIAEYLESYVSDTSSPIAHYQVKKLLQLRSTSNQP